MPPPLSSTGPHPTFMMVIQDAVPRGEVSRDAEEPSLLFFTCGSTLRLFDSPLGGVMVMASVRAITLAAAAQTSSVPGVLARERA